MSAAIGAYLQHCTQRTLCSIPFLCYAVTTASLAAYMGKGYYDKRKIFPQGVLAGISTVMTLGYIGAL